MRTELPAERVRRRLASEPEAEAESEPAAAEADTSLSKWLPERDPGRGPNWVSGFRADPGRAGVVGLAVVGVAAVAVTIFTIAGRDRPQVVAANLPSVQPVSSAAPNPPSPANSPPADASAVVSVVGLVAKPGLVTLPPAARVADALAAAGGALAGADLTGLNMARRVADGEQIVVGIAAPPGVPPAMGSSISSPAGADATPSDGPGGAESAPIDLNAATVDDLDALPGVGPVTAAAIVAWRDANGRFANVDQLGDVDGIGPARLEKLRALVRV